MFLGTKELLKRVKEEKLIENLSEREVKRPEGAGFDLRVGSVHKFISNKAFLGETERFTPKTKELLRYNPRKKDQSSHVLKPGEYVIIKTLEKVNLPNDLSMVLSPRTTLFRSGISLYSSAVTPGYSGELYFGMLNHGNVNFKLQMGARVVQALFVPIGGRIISGYMGQWQNGKLSTEGKTEVQI